MTEKSTLNSIPPCLKRIEERVMSNPSRSVILIDRLDYLVFKNEFMATLQFVYKLREISYFSNLIVLLSVDPTTLLNQDLRLLEKEAKELDSRYNTDLSEEMLAVLRFIDKMNNLGVKPSYSDLKKELEISLPTVRKRIKYLLISGYLNETLLGNRKALELSQKGRTLFI